MGKVVFPQRIFVDEETCGFPITVQLDSYGTYQLFFDDAGELDRIMLHFTLVGTDSANGKTLNEINHGTSTFEFPEDTETLRGAGLQKEPDGGVVAIISGLHRADGSGAGRFDLPDNPGAYCAALS